jgi:hypothetical protein
MLLLKNLVYFDIVRNHFAKPFERAPESRIAFKGKSIVLYRFFLFSLAFLRMSEQIKSCSSCGNVLNIGLTSRSLQCSLSFSHLLQLDTGLSMLIPITFCLAVFEHFVGFPRFVVANVTLC